MELQKRSIRWGQMEPLSKTLVHRAPRGKPAVTKYRNGSSKTFRREGMAIASATCFRSGYASFGTNK